MPENQTDPREETILVDFEMSGVRGVARISREDLIEKSKTAVDTAMFTMRLMAAKAVDTIKKIKISERPQKVELEFGLKLDAEAGALVAKAGTEAAIKVTLTWEHKEENK